MRTKSILASFCYVLVSTVSLLAADQLVISEFAADNAGPLRDENGDLSDWIEIHNVGTNAANIGGWYLTDSAANLTKWQFPSNNIPPNGYQVVFASNKDRRVPGATNHTNFKLEAGGEYLALVRPDGTNVASAYAPKYPAQVGHVSYGIAAQQTVTTLLSTGAVGRLLIPTNDALAQSWVAADFDDSAWTLAVTGLGYETDAGPTNLIGSIASNIQTAMRNVNASAYLRLPFVVTNKAALNFLTLRMKYDDGFVASLNGINVAVRNQPIFPDVLTWNSAATTNRFDGDVNGWEEIDITPYLGDLHDGTNVLAIHGLNASAGDSDFLILPEIRATGVAPDAMLAYFSNPTPGTANGVGSTNIGPVIASAAHTPAVPQDNEDLFVTAQVFETFHSISNVQLNYRVMFSNEVTVAMFDDGLHGDGPAGDGTYGAIIPANAASPGQMIRYAVTSRDVRTNTMRLPSFLSATTSPQYFGTIVHAAQTNGLPLFHLFIPDATLASANNDSAGRYPCSVFYLGEFYDNCGINRHGQSSAGFPKKSYDIDFNPGHNFKWKEGEDRVDDINLLTTYPDKSHMRNLLAYGSTFQASGSPYHYVEPIRIHTNGGFFGDWHLVENGDDNYLKRIGRDPNGSLYKMYNTFNDVSDYTLSSGEAEKKTRKQEGNADLVALYNAVNNASLAVRTNYMYDNIDIAEVLNTMAARSVTSDWDCCHKNYYFYRDSDGTGEWQAFPWDIDLSFGRNWSSAESYWDDRVYPQNRIWGNWDNNGFFQVVLNMPLGRGIDATRQMYLRRVRTLMDELLQTNGTPAGELHYEKRMDELVPVLAPDAALDLAKWGTWGGGNIGPVATNTAFWRTLPQAVAELKTNYFPARRNYVFNQLMGLSGADIVNFASPQPTNIVILIGALDYNPISANQAEEYVQLINTNRIAVDISGWTLSGGLQHTFQGGVVIPSSNSVYLVANKKTFRARAAAPKGGMGLYVEGPYQGQLSARGETLTLTDKRGRVVTTNSYLGSPSGAQQYLRITEVMYRPAPPASGPYVQDDFEYLELKNIGPVAISLAGVHFTNGLDFAFSPATTTNLNAGQTLILARNPAAFAARYPAVTSPVFAYGGTLDNNGETIRVDDIVGEKILEFAYNNSWYPMTDGNGFSLVIVNENAPFNTWGEKASWRPSGEASGSPGAVDPAPVVVAPILVNEVLAHTDFPVVDAIELYNPTTNAVDISGWWISDDFSTPRKYRIPAPSFIPAGGYAVFTESDFNIGGLGFSFSSHGDEAYVFSGNALAELSGYYHGFQFGASENPVSFGRHFTSTGAVHIVAQSSNTLGSANAVPKTGPVVISEIMYRPPDVNGADNTLDEFVELQNLTTNEVRLYSVAFPTNRWRLDDGINYTFSTNDVIPPNGFMLVVNFNPTNVAALDGFRSKYGVPANVPVAGPYSGKLDNGGESLELYRPDVPDLDGTPFILVERLHYADLPPWDGGADGFGPSLQRRVVSDYGNEQTNWFAALPNAGRAGAGGEMPSITQQPQNITVLIGANTDVPVTVAGGQPFGYQWQWNGAALSGQTNSSLVLTNIQLSQTGLYSVVVFNDAGVAFSSNAVVTVLTPINFSLPPASQNVLPGTNVTLSAVVLGNGPIRYQWRFEGVDLPGATNASYSFTNASVPTHHGLFSVLVTDDYGSLLSTNARIFVLIKPGIITHPLAQTVLQAGTARFSVTATGAPPLYFRWLRNGALWASNTFPDLVITNCQSNGTFRVTVGNLAGTTGSLPAGGVALNVLRDFDGDGQADLWETNYPGFSTNNAADALLDFDGDSMINRDEYVAGTNPADALSLLKIILSTTNTSALQFVAQTNIGYTVQSRTNLASAFWNNISNITASPLVRTVTVDVVAPPGLGERYYRIVTPLVP